MKISITGAWILTLALAGSWAGLTSAADIYKTVDADGNPVYTDRPPTPDAKPISLRELSVVETPSYESRIDTGNSGAGDEDAPTVSDLRQRYSDFRLVSPAPDQNFWGTANTATIAWDSDTEIAGDLSVVFFVDGQAVSQPTTQPTFSTGRLDRGEHQARADLVDGDDQVIASAGPVTFYIMQNSRLNQNRATPLGGN